MPLDVSPHTTHSSPGEFFFTGPTWQGPGDSDWPEGKEPMEWGEPRADTSWDMASGGEGVLGGRGEELLMLMGELRLLLVGEAGTPVGGGGGGGQRTTGITMRTEIEKKM